MSVTPLERPTTRVVETPRPLVKRTPRVEPVPNIRLRTRVVERRRVATPALGIVLRAGAFCATFGISYFVSSLTGQVMVERARRTEITAKERMRDALRAESAISSRVDELTDGAKVAGWAKDHGFVTAAMLAEADAVAKKAKQHGNHRG